MKIVLLIFLVLFVVLLWRSRKMSDEGELLWDRAEDVKRTASHNFHDSTPIIIDIDSE